MIEARRIDVGISRQNIIEMQRGLHFIMRRRLFTLLSQTKLRQRKSIDENSHLTSLEELNCNVRKLDITDYERSTTRSQEFYRSHGVKQNTKVSSNGKRDSQRNASDTLKYPETSLQQYGSRSTRGSQDRDDDDEERNKRRKLSSTPASNDGRIALRFACPYYKRNPERNRKYRSCYCAPGFETVARMK